MYLCRSHHQIRSLAPLLPRTRTTLGYVPVCPPLQDGQYLVLADPAERADYNEIVREKILRCALLVLLRPQKADATTAAQNRPGPASTAASFHRACDGLQTAAVEQGEALPC